MRVGLELNPHALSLRVVPFPIKKLTITAVLIITNWTVGSRALRGSTIRENRKDKALYLHIKYYIHKMSRILS